ncbi:DUF4233 domain-containing protein [Zafaria sp. Z1313]|uniref:DUF4233 domain-containing protein n=1 Tax=unclassified Zafaria TaxID=2828765 RepID=UPI002E779D56|nr:DUF4233 domain-containing protein [Zafaria sp. J156]MEE1622476.1 DUF4233 domain-containing protein [Zafaria sp. J156]MEE1622981.1 DUF4233 domain-containing protein [Zafaria sp. J156]
MARLTKAQREWRPGMKKPRRSVRTLFASTVLTLEAFVVLFATLGVFGLHRGAVSAWLIWGIGLGLALLCLATCAFLGRPFGYWIGWGIQVLLVGAGFIDPYMFIVGALFAAAWWYAVTKGGAIDAENAERDRAQARWEAEHPEAGSD